VTFRLLYLIFARLCVRIQMGLPTGSDGRVRIAVSMAGVLSAVLEATCSPGIASPGDDA